MIPVFKGAGNNCRIALDRVKLNRFIRIELHQQGLNNPRYKVLTWLFEVNRERYTDPY